MTDSSTLRCWIYETLAQVFDHAPRAVPEPPGGTTDDDHAARRTAMDALLDAIATTPLADVEADYVRLFVNAPGGVAAPPYASWYLEGRLLGAAASWAAAAYARQGLEPAPDAGEPPDYLSTELEFMHFLCRHETAARTTADAQALALVLDAQAAFVHEHLARWMPLMLARTRSAKPGPVVAAATTLAELQIAIDVQRLGPRRHGSA